MKTFSFYHKETGLLNGCSFSTDDDTQLDGNFSLHLDHLPIEGDYDHLSQSVDLATGEVIDYQPPAPSADYEWNTITRRWQLGAAVQSKIEDHAASMVTITGDELRSLRALREFALGMPGAEDRLKAIEAEIVAARSML